MNERRWWTLAILNILMNCDGYLSNTQIVERLGCERKSVYHAVALLECNGFGIDVIKTPQGVNKYKYIGLYGLD